MGRCLINRLAASPRVPVCRHCSEHREREGRQPLCTNASAYLQVDEKRD